MKDANHSGKIHRPRIFRFNAYFVILSAFLVMSIFNAIPSWSQGKYYYPQKHAPAYEAVYEHTQYGKEHRKVEYHYPDSDYSFLYYLYYLWHWFWSHIIFIIIIWIICRCYYRSRISREFEAILNTLPPAPSNERTVITAFRRSLPL